MFSQVAVLVVAYGSPDLLDATLRPLQDAGILLVVVDNSDDQEVRGVAEACGATYLNPGSNLGFAAGVNYGMRRIPNDLDVLLLNPDAVIAVRDVHRLCEGVEREHVAAISPRLSQPDDGQPQRVSWPFPTPTRMWAASVIPGWKGPSEYVVGSCLLLRRTAWADVGAMDERFFLYAEETDWEFRAARRGWLAVVAPGSAARHVGAGTAPGSNWRETIFTAAAETYMRKWYGTMGWAVYRAGAVLGATLRVLPGDAERRRRSRRRLGLLLRGPRRAAGMGDFA